MRFHESLAQLRGAEAVAYLDESGSTGLDLLNAQQPFFTLGALVGPVGLDVELRPAVAAACAELGVPRLHAADLAPAQRELVAARLREPLTRLPAYWWSARIEKRCLLFVDLFNAIVVDNPYVLDDMYVRLDALKPLVQVFRNYLTDAVLDQMLAAYVGVLKGDKAAISRLTNLLDIEGRRLDASTDELERMMGRALRQSAHDGYGLTPKHRRHHAPHVHAYAFVLGDLIGHAHDHGFRFAQVVHDTQTEYEGSLRQAHAQLREARPLVKPGGFATDVEPAEDVVPPTLDFTAAVDAPALQVVDLLLWLQQTRERGRNGELGDAAKALLADVIDLTNPALLTFEQVHKDAWEAIVRLQEAHKRGEIPKDGCAPSTGTRR
jgi:hypothetical protein